MRVLVVEDDRTLVNIERRLLEESGYLVEVASTVTSALGTAAGHSFDGIILDYSLPDGTGLDVLRALRARGDMTPVLFVTAQDDQLIIAQILNSGADDYVVKPLTAEHWLARVRLLLGRERRGPVGDLLSVGDLQLDRSRHRLLRDGNVIDLTRKEFAFLEYLFLRAGTLVTRTALLTEVWGISFDPGTNVIDVHVARVRRLLRDAGTAVTISTRRGEGFELTVPLSDAAM